MQGGRGPSRMARRIGSPIHLVEDLVKQVRVRVHVAAGVEVLDLRLELGGGLGPPVGGGKRIGGKRRGNEGKLQYTTCVGRPMV